MFTKPELRHLRGALVSAIQWEDSLSDAHHVAYNKRNPTLPKTVPPEHRAIVARCKRRIAAYQNLLVKINRSSTTEKAKT